MRKQRGKQLTQEQSPKTDKPQRPKRKREKGIVYFRDHGGGVGGGEEEGGGGAITILRLYLVNDIRPSLYFLLVLCSRMMGCKLIPAPMETASEQQSFPRNIFFGRSKK